MTTTYVGARVMRTEDPALLRGQGQYVDDIHLEGMLEASFVRSPHAHARVKSIDVAPALAVPGVHAVLTWGDLPASAQKVLPLLVPNPAIIQPKTQYCLAKDEVCFVGEALAVVVADNRYIAEDAVSLVEVDYETLPAISHCRTSLAPGAATVHGDSKDNLAAHTHIVVGKPEEAFRKADLVVRETYWQHRGCAHPMETRGVVAEYRAVTGELTTWCSGQSPFLEKKCLVDLLDWNPELLRVIHPDVGGGFGPKTMFYIEQAVLAVLAVRLKRPVKWIEDRREHFLTTTQERDQKWDVELALARTGGKIKSAPLGAQVGFNAFFCFAISSRIPRCANCMSASICACENGAPSAVPCTSTNPPAPVMTTFISVSQVESSA